MRAASTAAFGLGVAARLDRMVETRARAGEEMLAQISAGDWPGFLSLFDIDTEDADAEGHRPPSPSGSAAATTAPTRSPPCGGATPRSRMKLRSFFRHAQRRARTRGRGGPTLEEQAAQMTIWHDEDTDELRTNFPPPDDFVGIEEGRFGDGGL